jgi:hypothetical protein
VQAGKRIGDSLHQAACKAKNGPVLGLSDLALEATPYSFMDAR